MNFKFKIGDTVKLSTTSMKAIITERVGFYANPMYRISFITSYGKEYSSVGYWYESELTLINKSHPQTNIFK